MINLTPNVVLTKDFTKQELDREIRDAITYAIEYDVAKQELKVQDCPGYNKTKGRLRSSFYLKKELSRKKLFDLGFLNGICAIAQKSNIAKSGPLPKEIEVLTETKNLFKQFKHIKRVYGAFRLILLRLWSSGVVCLPIGFKVQRSIDERVILNLMSEVSKFFMTFIDPKDGKNRQHPSLGDWDRTDFHSRGSRWVWATSWHKVEDVCLFDMARLHTKMIKGDGWLSGVRFPFTSCLKELHFHFEGRLPFSTDEVNSYARFFKGGTFNLCSFEEYAQNPEKFYTGRQRVYRETAVKRVKDKIISNLPGPIEDGECDAITTKFEAELFQLARNGSNDAIREYFAKLANRPSNLFSNESYVGRKHIDVAENSALWFKIFRIYLDNKLKSGYQSASSLGVELGILKDYLFCYLPWWNEKNPTKKVQIPYFPPDFKRFPFWTTQLMDHAEAEMPLSFLKFLDLRRKTINSKGRTVSAINALFSFLEKNSDLFPGLKGKEFKNPVDFNLDFPKGRRRVRTNKPALPKKILPYFLQYLYSLEEFGMRLQETAKEGRLKFGLKSQPESFEVRDYGIDLSICCNNKTFPIHTVPNIFNLLKRKIMVNQGQIRDIYIPHLTILRLLIIMFETGLRGKSVIWLDKRNWDSRNEKKPAETEVFELLVNTDKIRTEPWITAIIARARNVLLRENLFQDSIVEESQNIEVYYSGRKNSHFGKILPLFRAGGKKGLPVYKRSFYDAWVALLNSFQSFYNDNIGGEHIRLVKLTPIIKKDSSTKVEALLQNNFSSTETLSSPLRLAAIYTPHSLRSTFITHRISIIGIDMVASLVGHTDIRTTYHYVYPDFADISSKLIEADSGLMGYNPLPAINIRSDVKNSRLRSSWGKDRIETEKAYGFTSVSLFNYDGAIPQSGIELLRTTNQSEVHFRETHICPVGENCPSEVISIILEPRRCGLCPLSVSSVDHAPAIVAKMRQLLERIQGRTRWLDKNSDEPENTIEQVNHERKLDCSEYAGWLRTLLALNEFLSSKDNFDQTYFVVDKPEIIKNQLKLIVKSSNETEFILERIVDAKNFPQLKTEALGLQMSRLSQKLLAGLRAVDDQLDLLPDVDDMDRFLSSLKIYMDREGIQVHELISRLENRKENDQLLLKSASKAIDVLKVPGADVVPRLKGEIDGQ